MQPIETEMWKTLIPEHWVYDEDEEGLSIYDPNGAGVMFITCSEREDGLVDEEDLEYFASELIEDNYDYRRVRCGNLAGLLFEYDDEDTSEHWKEWYLACDDLFFYITWNRPLDEGSEEEHHTQAILHDIVPVF